MKTFSEVVILIGRIDRVELHRWVELGWVAPEPAGEQEELAFSEVDIARVRLICDLRHDLAVEEETVPLVLSLLDQLYALRRQMRTLSDAVRQQPDEVQRAILDLVAQSRRPGGRLG